MPLDNYPYFILQNCSNETFCKDIKQVDNLGRLAVIESHIGYSIKLRIIANRRLEIVYQKGYNIGKRTRNIIPN